MGVAMGWPTAKRFAQATSLVALLVSVAVLAGWIFNAPVLTTLAPGWTPMVPATAVTFAFAAAALGLLTVGKSRAALILALVVGAVGVVRVASHVFGWSAPIDFFGLPGEGRMSPATAASFVLLGGAFALSRSRWLRTFQALAIFVLLLGWLGLARYAYGGVLAPYMTMAAHTAALVLLFGAATLATREDIGVVALLTRRSLGGLSARRLLPAAVIAPLAMGGLSLYAERTGWFGTEVALALFAMATVAALGTLVWLTAQDLDRIERDAESRLRQTVESALDAVITIDRHGRITEWSGQAETIFGWSKPEVIGQVLADTIVPLQHRSAHRRGLERYLATGEGRVLDKRIELTALRRNGTEFPVELAISVVGEGERLAFNAFLRDIAERKEAEERLRTQLERLSLLDRTTRAIGQRQDPLSILRTALQHLEDELPIDFGCVCLAEDDRRTLVVSAVATRSRALAVQLGIAERARIVVDDNGLARCMRGELVSEPDLRLASAALARGLAGAGLGSMVVAPLLVESEVFGALIAARTGVNRLGSADCEYLRQLSEHLGLAVHQAQLYSALQRAYAELRQNQETAMQQERLRALGQLASGIAHDINNALSPAAIYTQSLLERDRTLSDNARECLSLIDRAIHDVARTATRLRDFSRQREPVAAHAPVDLNQIVEQVAALTRARWYDMPQERGTVIEPRFELDRKLPPFAGVDNEIRDALTNLVLNAVDAMPDGGTLTIRTRTVADGADRTGTNTGNSPIAGSGSAIHLEVIDTGIGMDEETRTRCLEPFYSTKGERGTGLGLAMVYAMARRHGGTLDIASEPEHGTTVSLKFPVAHCAPASAPGDGQAAAPVTEPGKAGRRQLRLLVIDDDPLIRDTLADTLDLDGHTVVVAEGGRTGIDAFRTALADPDRRFDLVLTDLGMPHVDGRAVAAAIKRMSADTPVILLTGWGHRMAADGDKPEHVDRVMSKPPSLVALRAAVAELTGRR